ncbi:hypothetical protein FB451DRAFT_1415477 [Mycena latifolia]|nr:hypothetical protein FB451DRAFT_1415477 [Mycena latifolia]
MDGEGIEHPWANIRPVATSTWEMGPGSRIDMLDDHWSHWNWQKLVGLGFLLMRRLLNAISERNFQEESLATFTTNQMEHVPEWKAMVKAFNADNMKPNPYEHPKTGITEHNVQWWLAEEEAKETTPIHNVTPSVFVLVGLELEEQQQHLKIEVESRKDLTTKQTVEMLEKHTKLGCYTARFRTLQGVYTPAALQALSDHPAPAPGKEEEAGQVENVPLYMPLALLEAQRTSGCFKGVIKIEERLRGVQLWSVHSEICNLLHIKSRFQTYKGSNTRHQGATMRSWNLMDRNNTKIRIQAEKYIVAWEAKRLLAGQRCRGKTGEGKRTISWIWMGVDTSRSATDKVILTSLHVEWAKVWARTKHWIEEVDLLKEEMRHVPITMRWKA